MASAYPALKSPDSNIRLLRIHPSHPLRGIETSLECASFLERPQYRALSYTWGDSKRTKPITVNGKKMLITENLWKALFHIRDRQQAQTLWVDAICIDQSNDEEKSVQVPLMSFIYSRAKEVLVWLG
ncbi:HET-domain-containing protein, partial [Rhizodiscina lignyota]